MAYKLFGFSKNMWNCRKPPKYDRICYHMSGGDTCAEHQIFLEKYPSAKRTAIFYF